jgi:hypothetical protein
MKKDQILFPKDQKKIEEAVVFHTMGSNQIGEIARISSSLYDDGIDVIEHLKELHEITRSKPK